MTKNSALSATLHASRVNEEFLQSELTKNGNGSTFRNRFEEELQRLARVVHDQQFVVEIAAKANFGQAHTLATGKIESVRDSFATLHDLKLKTRQTVQDSLTLQEFVTESRTTFLCLAQRADKQPGGTEPCSALVQRQMPRATINSSLVCVVSDTFEALRQAEEKIVTQSNPEANALWQAPSSFERTTTKYWVKDENLTKLMMTCAAEAPLLVYGKKGPLTSTKKSDLQKSDGDKLWDSLATRITSIYFDSQDMGLYKERLKRAEGAQLLRARWYGPVMPSGDKIIFVELKTHHEKWVANKSVKERALVLERDMVKFLEPIRWTKEDAQAMILRAKPNMKAEEIPKATGLLLRMHNLVVRYKLTACVRSVYDRAAFQSSTSNDLRLTLDRNVTLVDERVERSTSSKGRWCLSDAEAVAARASVVPFNVFEIKLASDDDMPAGLVEAQDDSTLVQAPKFSKFLTGAAAFNAVPTLPYWAAHTAFYAFFNLALRGVPQPSSEASGNYALLDVTSDEKANITLPDGVTIAPKKPPRIEPKTFFANERTFIQWINASTLLLSVSGLLLSAGDFQKTAAVISFSAFGLLVYSTNVYFQRLHKLKGRHAHGYFDKVKPIVMTAVVLVAVFLVFTDSIKGSDFLTFKKEIDDRRLLSPRRRNRRGLVQKEIEDCSLEFNKMELGIEETPTSFLVDSERNAFLLTLKESVYIQSSTVKRGETADMVAATSLVKIHNSRLRGIVDIEDRLFVVSDGPESTDLIELAWWGSTDERLRVVGRWTLEENSSQVTGFAYVPTVESQNRGNFYIHMNASVNVYSVPSRNEGDGHSDRPWKLKSLNMKVLNQGMAAGRHEIRDHVSSMHAFEGITYVLNPTDQILEAWDMTTGSLVSEVELPLTESSTTVWTDFAFKKRPEISTESRKLRGYANLDEATSDRLFIYLLSSTDDIDGDHLWSFRVYQNVEARKGISWGSPCLDGPGVQYLK